ncbi:hypothetical protein FJP69_20835 [Stenotrophomonas maltophilia]|nr:hypothetical protein FJP69_20835 [Stenotrophomonas maltophilia]
MCYEENATGHYCTLTGQGELAIAAGEGHCVPYSALFGSEPFFVEKGIRLHPFFRCLIEIHPRMAWIYRVDQGRHPPTAKRRCAAICRRRGGSGGGGVRGMDAAAKPPR